MTSPMIMRFVITGICVLIAAGVGFLTFDWYYERSHPKPYGVSFELTSTDGRTVTESAFRGHPTVLFFGYTHCQDVCPTTLYEMGEWLKDIGDEGRNMRAWFVTVDPKRDTPEIMKSYLDNFSSRIKGLSGPPGKVHAMLKGFSIYYRKVAPEHAQDHETRHGQGADSMPPAGGSGNYDMAHTTNVLLLDSHGRLFDTISYTETAQSAETKLRRLARN